MKVLCFWKKSLIVEKLKRKKVLGKKKKTKKKNKKKTDPKKERVPFCQEKKKIPTWKRLVLAELHAGVQISKKRSHHQTKICQIRCTKRGFLLIQKHKQSPRIVILEAVYQFVVLLLSTFFGFSIFAAGFSFAFGKFAHYRVVLLHAPLEIKKKIKVSAMGYFSREILIHWSISIIAWLAYDKKEGGVNRTQNLLSKSNTQA